MKWSRNWYSCDVGVDTTIGVFAHKRSMLQQDDGFSCKAERLVFIATLLVQYGDSVGVFCRGYGVFEAQLI